MEWSTLASFSVTLKHPLTSRSHTFTHSAIRNLLISESRHKVHTRYEDIWKCQLGFKQGEKTAAEDRCIP